MDEHTYRWRGLYSYEFCYVLGLLLKSDARFADGICKTGSVSISNRFKLELAAGEEL